MKVTGWKNWPYWVKGGLISAFLPILSWMLAYLSWILVILSYFSFDWILWPSLSLLDLVTYVPWEIAFRLHIDDYLFDDTLFGAFPKIAGVIFLVFIWFVAGAVISMIIGKIKSK